jgi:putative intracellular protease/amidase
MSTIHLAVYDTLSDWETGYATAHIVSPAWHRSPDQFRVVTVGPSLSPVTSMGGMRIQPDIAIGSLDPADSAMLILPGSNIWNTPTFEPFAAASRRFLDAGVPVAAICGATGGLALAGLLDDRAHTSNAAEFLAGTGYAGGHLYRDEPAMTDGDLITASGVRPVEFAVEIFRRLGIYGDDVLGSWFKLYGQHDPAGFFELMAA